ncbi:MAG: hypothetical protein ISS65_04270 [Desulfobacterales bacterium]|nr:hypothetical protein [Desulfobacterales bacterium]
MEYQALMKELEQLETDKKDLKPGDETNRFNESASRFNQKVRDYELKCKAFESEVRANKAQVDKESREQLLDNEKFSIILI